MLFFGLFYTPSQNALLYINVRTRAYKEAQPKTAGLKKQKKLFTSAARFAVSRAFFTARSRRRIHRPRIIPFGFPTAIGTNHRIGIAFHKLVKTLAATFAFVL